jgi:fermentation-respiration switch protein FrsA (DUF1100 family)
MKTNTLINFALSVTTIHNQYKGLPHNFVSMRFPRQIVATDDPNKVIVRYTGQIPLRTGGRYDNRYVGIFEVKGGKLTRFTEFFDPLVLQQAFGTARQENVNVTTSAPAGVVVRRVSFPSEGLSLAGDLYLPDDFDATRTYPTVIVLGSWTSVKEQMAGLYARELAGRGLVALAFDPRYWGQSEGQPRQYENPEAKATDVRSAATYLLAQPFVNPEQLTALGICAGGGYVAAAAAQDPRLRQVVLVAAWLHDKPTATTIYNNWPGGYNGLVAKGNQAAWRFGQTGEVAFVPAASETDPNAAMYVPKGTFPYYVEAKLGAMPAYTNRFAVMSWPKWLGFDGVAPASRITQPIYLIHSEKAALPEGARRFYSQLPGAKNSTG